MQAGQYRRALGFAAHVAGEHAEVPAAAALYAWLLRAGGQVEVAARVLAAALARLPDDPVALAATRAFASPVPTACGVLLDPPQRVAPFAAGEAGGAAEPARVIASGVLLPGGAFALVPATSLRVLPNRLRVRNGLGQSRDAEIDRCGSAASPAETIVLRLREPITGNLPPASRDPFAGSLGFALAYATPGPDTPAWPQLSQGFLGAPRGLEGARVLGFEVPAGQQGGPVLDANGQLAGMVLTAGDGQALLLPVSKWPRLSHCDTTSAPMPPLGDDPPQRRPAISADEAYERGLPIALQVIALP